MPGPLIPVDSTLGRELAKWEQFPSSFTSGEVPPGNPYVYRPFPQTMFLGGTDEKGRWGVVSTRIAKDDGERSILQGQGYTEEPQAAIISAKADDAERAEAEARLLFEQQHRLKSAGAKAEVQAAIDASPDHVGEVPETPIRRGPGRPRKPVAPAEE